MATPRARHHRAPTRRQRPALYLGVTAAGAVLAHVLVGAAPAAPVEATEPVSVAAELGLTAQTTPDMSQLADLAASRSSREDQQAAAASVQAAADQAALDQQAAEAAAAEAAAAEAAAAEAAAASAAESSAAVSASTAAVAGTARITNSAGPVSSRVQAAADAVVSNVPGADSITLGGTRPSAADPDGHPSGNALDYMVLTDEALGDAIVQYHRDHWSELGVEYLIWEQRMLSSPNGSWVTMEDRGGTTANHYDHVHVNYR
ncbi:hypothetical protein SAMN05660199_00990 [Klenkia soli]|uniref:ARB-07466-like C-terminal domain-containing protein n=1 Tax=Klenkia soli TaxID=1052260 RepID=A0A1H0FQK7_9ACTN|nr:hypothetical protein [Klenkia soli]SDN96917.1 hypothetical protein SAMN05660199_00990 [Klenkia soli]